MKKDFYWLDEDDDFYVHFYDHFYVSYLQVYD